jgi:hypothetical protein
MLGLGKGELHLFSERPREVVAADGNVTDPNLLAIGHEQRRIVGTHVEQDRVGIHGDRVVAQADAQLIEAQEVVERQRGDLNQLDFQLRVRERPQLVVDLVSLHREQANLRLQQEAALLGPLTERLIVPNDIFQGERDLLPSFVLDDLADFARLDGRQLNEAGQG